MATEALRANGINLNSLASNVEDISAILRTAKRRGENIAVPGRHGLLRVPNKLYDMADFVLPFHVLGVDPGTGQVLGGDAEVTAFYARADELTRLFGSDLITLEHTLPDGSVRRALAETTDVMEWTREPGSPLFGRVSVALRLPEAFWADTAPTTVTFTGTNGTHRVLSEFAAATAPMDELVITWTGPINNPELSQPAGGVYVAYDGVIPAGRKLVVDTAAWRLDPGDGTPWTPDYRAFRRGGSAGGRWFQLMPEPAGPEVIFVHTTGGSAGCTIAGPRKYLNG